MSRLTKKGTRLQRYEGTRRLNRPDQITASLFARTGHCLRMVAGAILLAALSVGPIVTAANADDLEQSVLQYRRKLAAYNQARAAYDVLAKPYWASISEKRKLRFAKE